MLKIKTVYTNRSESQENEIKYECVYLNKILEDNKNNINLFSWHPCKKKRTLKPVFSFGINRDYLISKRCESFPLMTVAFTNLPISSAF